MFLWRNKKNIQIFWLEKMYIIFTDAICGTVPFFTTMAYINAPPRYLHSSKVSLHATEASGKSKGESNFLFLIL